jgi:hypothetical protein
VQHGSASFLFVVHSDTKYPTRVLDLRRRNACKK